MLLLDFRKVTKIGGIIVCTFFLFLCIILAYRAVITSGSIIPQGEVKYKDYQWLEGKLSYKLPEKWETREEKFGGEEIIYHNNLTSDNSKIHGFVEVWNLNKPLLKFIEEGKKSAADIISFKSYTIEPVRINGREGYILQYSKAVDAGKYVKAFEVFIIGEGNSFLRFAFYMDEDYWRDEYRMFFLNIAALANFKG